MIPLILISIALAGLIWLCLKVHVDRTSQIAGSHPNAWRRLYAG